MLAVAILRRSVNAHQSVFLIQLNNTRLEKIDFRNSNSRPTRILRNFGSQARKHIELPIIRIHQSYVIKPVQMDHHKSELETRLGLAAEYEGLYKDGSVMPMSREENQWSFSIEYNMNATASVIWAHLLDCWPIVTIVLITRLFHLVLDLTLPNFRWLKDLVTIVLGCIQINSYLEKIGFVKHSLGHYFIFTVILTYVVYSFCSPDKQLPKKKTNLSKASKIGHLIYLSTAVVVLLPIVINEYMIHFEGARTNTYLRGLLMTLSMKLAYNIVSRRNLLTSFAYLVHPASCIFGPWHQYIPPIDTEPQTIRDCLSKFMRGSLLAFVVFTKAVGCLFISVVILDYITGELEASSEHSIIVQPLLVFFGAQEFRFSHYFICFLTSSFLTLWQESDEEKKVCGVFAIEWPRSLVQVVIQWNIPMHQWLKDYVFMPIKSRCSSNNTFVPIVATYLVSSTLHGFKFHIWAVLLSLGLLTWSEYHMRLKLARRLGACVMASSCTYGVADRCTRGHERTSKNSVLVSLINFGFRILAMAHLAYLGFIFRGNSDEATYLDGLEIWSQMYYYSHVILILTYCGCFLI